MTYKDCKYQFNHPRKAYKKARWIKPWIRYYEREGYVARKDLSDFKRRIYE